MATTFNPDTRARFVEHITHTEDAADLTVILITIHGDRHSLQHVAGVNGRRIMHAARSLLEQARDALGDEFDDADEAGNDGELDALGNLIENANEAIAALPDPLADDDEEAANG